jgi:predicted DsbA family dithiol-disulfide isomerase
LASERSIRVEYFSDVLCVWAYGGQVRIEQLERRFGQAVQVVHRFLPLFAATGDRIRRGWEARGGCAGFARHVQAVAAEWAHVAVHSQLWLQDVPASSTPAHLFLKAVQLLEQQGELAPDAGSEPGTASAFRAAVGHVRQAFFRDARNIARQAVLDDIARALGLPLAAMRRLLADGQAHAALQLDVDAKERYQVPGSPTLVLNEGRQRLYGNVGYRVIEANVSELLRDPRFGEATWC